MNESMQKLRAWRPLGVQAKTLRDALAVARVFTRPQSGMIGRSAAAFVSFRRIDQSESCGFRRNARVINF